MFSSGNVTPRATLEDKEYTVGKNLESRGTQNPSTVLVPRSRSGNMLPVRAIRPIVGVNGHSHGVQTSLCYDWLLEIVFGHLKIQTKT